MESITPQTATESEEHDNDRITCWVCFASKDDEPNAVWIQPCRCKGTTRWVHDYCIQRWIDEKQGNNPTVPVRCSQCNALYVIKYPSLGFVLVAIGYCDHVVDEICPLAAGAGVIGSMYWAAVSYGALTVTQVYGYRDAIEMMERADLMFLVVALPTIPLGLLLTKMVNWEEYVLQGWRKYSDLFLCKLKSFFGIEDKNVLKREPVAASNSLDFLSSTRIICGALLLPTFATIFGRYAFSDVKDPFRRTMLGGACFTLIKGVIRIYYRQQQYIRLAQRTIEPFQHEASTPI